jgi:hypothetical protein
MCIWYKYDICIVLYFEFVFYGYKNGVMNVVLDEDTLIWVLYFLTLWKWKENEKWKMKNSVDFIMI